MDIHTTFVLNCCVFTCGGIHEFGPLVNFNFQNNVIIIKAVRFDRPSKQDPHKYVIKTSQYILGQ